MSSNYNIMSVTNFVSRFEFGLCRKHWCTILAGCFSSGSAEESVQVTHQLFKADVGLLFVNGPQ